MYWGAIQTPAIFAIRMVVVSGGACCVNALLAPTRLKPAADDNVASKRRRVCLDCITVFSHLLDFLTPNAMFSTTQHSRLSEINTLK
jgi:hypothetical protein